MIELLIKYIQDKGYHVRVIPNVLQITREAKGRTFGWMWAYPPVHLYPDFEQYIYKEADARLRQIEKAIADYRIGETHGNHA